MLLLGVMMKAQLTWKVLAASLLLASCAQTQPKSQAFTVQPLEGVRHSYDQAKANYELGRYYHGQRRYEQAVVAYRKALAIEPGRRDAEMAIGVAYAEKGDLARAREQLERIAALHPESPDAYNNLGFVNYLAGDYQAAARACKQALRLDGGHEIARRNLILAMGKLGLAEQIARTELPPASMRDTQTPERAVGTRWIEVSRGVYEMRPRAAPPAHAVGTEPGVVVLGTPAAAHAATEMDSVTGGAVEVANGNGVRGMGAAVARYFSGKGVRPSRVTNQKPFNVRLTRIEYRPGSAAEAKAIGRLFPHAAEQRVSSNLRADIRVRVVLGRDIAANLALLRRELKLAVSQTTAPLAPL
jgi:hypothetical protein